MISPPRSQVTDSLLAVLRAAGIAVGDGDTPDGYPKADKPHAVLYGIGGGSFSGPPLANRHADVEAVYQVTSFGWQRDQAEQVADRLRGALLAAVLVMGAGVQLGIEPDSGPGAAEQEGTTWQSAERFTVAFTNP